MEHSNIWHPVEYKITNLHQPLLNINHILLIYTEILMGTGYRFEVDFWALGVLFFELLTGYLPFTRNDDDDDPESLKQSILNDAPDMIRVKYVTDDASVADVIESLLTKEVETRLGKFGKSDGSIFLFGFPPHFFFGNSQQSPAFPRGLLVELSYAYSCNAKHLTVLMLDIALCSSASVSALLTPPLQVTE